MAECIAMVRHEEHHMCGVGMVLDRQATEALVGWQPINDRIITARFHAPQVKTTRVQVYAPTEDTTDTDKDTFYDQLQDTINKIPRHDVIIFMGDLNAQIDNNRQGLEHGTARQTNDNGVQLLLFCNSNGLCVSNTYFPHKNFNKNTWRSPTGNVYTTSVSTNNGGRR